ncbi:hypothetical protein PC116_g6355 [Phytophthora cactorum]|nr:hypothetical protein PC116_g6355 [Phytophthora cactorum]
MAMVGTRLTQLGLNRTEPLRRTSRLAVHHCRVGLGLTPLEVRRRLRLSHGGHPDSRASYAES